MSSARRFWLVRRPIPARKRKRSRKHRRASKAAETGNLSKAAAALYISSSAVIQRINHLERDLGVSLFERGRYGVRLTKAGAYLAEEANSYIQKGIQIRRNLLSISSNKNAICIGTTQQHKVRLLYDLWSLFSGLGKQFDIRLVNLKNSFSLEREAELIESVKISAAWLSEWGFLHLYDVRIGCAVAHHHHLASQPCIRFQDLGDWTVYYQDCLDIRESATDTALYKELYTHAAALKKTENYDVDIMWKCACKPCTLIAPICWQDIMPDMAILPLENEYVMPYDFYYRKDASAPVRKFLDFVIDLYNGKFQDLPLPVIPSAIPVSRGGKGLL